MKNKIPTIKNGEADLVLNIKKLFDQISNTNRFYQDFDGDFVASRKFAEKIREMAPNLIKVEERNARVIMTVCDLSVVKNKNPSFVKIKI